MAFPAKEPDVRAAAPAATDGELVMRFVRRRDRSAIGELVHKHAPMVMSVCRQVLGSRADAEDAFQATFLILVKRARTIERKSSVAGWLYRVAYRTAMRLAVRRRRGKPEPLTEDLAGEPEVFSIISEREVRRVLHEELAQLPVKYREPILLFYFAGKTREEIAEELECTDAAVKGRLARGRKALRLALARRGVGLSIAMGAAVAATPSSTAAAAALSEKTILACTSALQRGADVASCSPKAIQLAQEGVRAMLLSSVAKFVVAPAVVGAALVAFAQIPDRTGEPPQAAATAGGLVLASDPIESQDSASSVAVSTTEAAPAVIVSSDDSVLTADASRLHVPDPSGVKSDPLRNPLVRATPPDVDAATSDMLAKYYELRADANAIRQDAKRMEIEAYAGGDRESLLDRAKQRELEADIIDLRAESELFSSRAKLLREGREGQANVPRGGAASTPALAGTEESVTTTPSASAARASDTIEPGERLRIETIGGNEEILVFDNEYSVEQSGTVPLGPVYGRVQIAGLSLVDAEQAIREHLREYVQKPQVQVTRAEPQLQLLRDRMDRAETAPSRTGASTTAPATAALDVVGAMPPLTADRALETIQPGDRLMIEARGVYPDEPIAQEYVVEQGGMVALGHAYGRVPIGGLPLENAESVIKNHLREYVANPQVQITRAGTDASETQLQSLRTEIRNLRAELEALRARRPGE